jgi:phosphopantothenoylcysteine decarboxylase/phosphopantothenate--cysteine ligase
VTLISGPVYLKPPSKVRTVTVETAAQMRAAMLKAFLKTDLIIMAAAVADYSPPQINHIKIKKTKATLTLRLKKTKDILQELGNRKLPGQQLVVFAAETNDLLKNAHAKMKSKNLDFIVANRVGISGSGFESDYNRAILLSRKGKKIAFGKITKQNLARQLIRLLTRTFE